MYLMKQKFLVVAVVLLLVSCGGKDQTKASFEETLSGVWKLNVGKPEKINLLSELHIAPKTEAIQKMEKVTLPISRDDIEIKLIDGKTYIRIPLEKEEKIFGLGLNFKTVEQRKRIMRLHVDHYGGKDDGRNHAPVPFFVSSRGYGALINSARYIDAWIGSSVRKDTKNQSPVRDRTTDRNWKSEQYSDNLEFLVPAEGVEIILFAGPTMEDAVRRFNLFNGGGVLPPRWGLGFWQRVRTQYSDNQVREEVAEFEKRDFPLSVIGLEPGWMSRAYPCTYEWDTVRFPKPEAFIKEMSDKNIKTNLWFNPYVSPEGELFKKIEPYTGTHKVWGGIIPDFTLPETKRIFMDHFDRHTLAKGVSGYKMDENDGIDAWLWPDVAVFPSGNTAEHLRQLYGSIMQDITMQAFRQRNQRSYGLVRAGNAGTTSFPYVIYNDSYNHREFITALINSSFIGVLWTPEVRASKSSEEWLRRMQTVCFSPLAMINAWADGTKPWSYPDVVNEVNEISKLRMRIIPYLYTAFADYAFEGIPPFRAMNLEPGYQADQKIEKGTLDATENPYALAVVKEMKDQFMVGRDLLIAPLFAGETEREVILPQGRWYDFYTGAFAGEGEIIKVAPGLSKIPVYVRDGGIVPLWPPITKITGKDKHPLEVRHYGTKASSYSLYDDDGETFNYEKGEFGRIALSVETNEKGEKKGTVKLPENGKVWSFSEFNFKFMTESKK
jgi:alpha-D-xyloside xylohydrolase